MQNDLNKFSDSESGRSASRLQILRDPVRRVWPFAVVSIVALLSVVVYIFLNPTPTPLTQEEVDESIINAMASATPPAAYSAQVYQAILPSLVIIQTQGENPDEEGQVGLGSGIIINDRGDILTAHHVVSGAVGIEITFADGSQVNAAISAAEPDNDIAVLHPNQPPELIVPAVLASPNGMRVGDETYAVGNPLGLAGSMSAGVISGFDRSFVVDETGQRLEGLIQFDAAVNPGNSGGPLLNRSGQVIGIVTALANPTEQNYFTGIGFAVPITTAANVGGVPAY